ncbi:hypothetical protein LCGC14_0227800 [marine sediment metagenome]|jgi:hypothetical protein|uniref:Uncharacterized protein n=1 Tax=marine sediment metagenome TaxID=412755 RepID=A0A0F9WVK0_9ZZZZ
MHVMTEGLVRLYQEAPRREKRRAHILQLINFRLRRGIDFSVEDLMATPKMKVSRRYVEDILKMAIKENLISKQTGGRYGPSPRNYEGCLAMVRAFTFPLDGFTRKDVRLGLAVALTDNMIDRLLRDLIAQGELQKLERGRYIWFQEVRKVA